MKRSTLVHAIAEKNCISFRTVSRYGKSPHNFYILRKDLADLEHKTEVVVRDIRSFATLRRDIHTGTVRIEFTWLGGDGHSVSGRQEIITLSYSKLMEFMRESIFESGPVEWKSLSMDDSGRRPKIVFKGRMNLHAALGNGIIRHKLVRALWDKFAWPDSERIELYDDCMPYSFVFHEIRGGKTAMTGGLILHGQEDMEKSYYSVHT